MKKELNRREELERSSLEDHRRELDNVSLLVKQKEEEIKGIFAQHDAELEKVKEQFRQEYAVLLEKYHVQNARFRACNAKDGSSDTEDFSSKESFAQLEAEYRAFKRYFESQWKLAKKRIRREVLGKKSDE